MKTKPILFFLLFVLLTFNINSQNQSVQNEVEKYSRQKSLEFATWGLYAKYIDNDEVVISFNEEKVLAPASGLKLVTTAAALNILGEDKQLLTRLFYDGNVDADGTLNGNIYFVGGGDPTLGSDLVKNSLPLDELIDSLISEIKNAGIKKVNGSVVGDALLFDGKSIPDDWYWIDIGNYYGTQTNALSINDNLYKLYFKPATVAGAGAKVLRTEPEIPGLTFKNFMKTGTRGSGDNGYIYSSPEDFEAELRGTVPAGYNEFSIKGSIPNPPLFAAQYLTKKMEEAGIEVAQKSFLLDERKTYDDENLIASIFSPPVKDIVYIVNKKSFNFYAEQLLKLMGLTKNKKGNIDAGIDAVENFFETNKIYSGGLNLQDGSGLSRSNGISAKTMVELLDFMSENKYFDSFYNSLALTGDPVDISSFSGFGSGTAIEKNARIKSGTIGGVKSHSGYVKDRNGRMIAFSFLANNYSGASYLVTNIHKSLMIMLAELQ